MDNEVGTRMSVTAALTGVTNGPHLRYLQPLPNIFAVTPSFLASQAVREGAGRGTGEQARFSEATQAEISLF